MHVLYSCYKIGSASASIKTGFAMVEHNNKRQSVKKLSFIDIENELIKDNEMRDHINVSYNASLLYICYSLLYICPLLVVYVFMLILD